MHTIFTKLPLIPYLHTHSIRFPRRFVVNRVLERLAVWQFRGEWPAPDLPHGHSVKGTRYFERLPKVDRDRALELLRNDPPKTVYAKMLDENRTSVRDLKQIEALARDLLIAQYRAIGSGYSLKDNFATQFEACRRLMDPDKEFLDTDKYLMFDSISTLTRTTIAFISIEVVDWVAEMHVSADGFKPIICIDAVTKLLFYPTHDGLI